VQDIFSWTTLEETYNGVVEVRPREYVGPLHSYPQT